MRMIGRAPQPPQLREWPADVRELFDAAASPPGWYPWRVLGGPGTGKTALLTDLAVANIAGGVDPESVLVLTQSRRAAGEVRGAVSTGLLGAGGVPGATRQPLVRTLHSYAFAVLRLHAADHGNPPPRLLTGAEQDAVLREMLRGELDDSGGAGWPERLRPALGLAGFAAEVRDVMLRAAERGLDPEDLVRLGRKRNRPEWVAVGKFAARYEQAMLLRWSVGAEAPGATAPALDAAELVGAALAAFAADGELLARERARIRYLYVDDAQHLDPQAARLVRLIGSGTARTVVAGDPDQAVYSFRGASAEFLTGLDANHQVVLRINHRAGQRVSEVAGAIARRLPGSYPHRGAQASEPGGRADARVFASVPKQAAGIADYLRRAHLEDGIAWSRMAVIVRSLPASVSALRRGLVAAGIPVTTAASELPLAQQRGAAWMLLVLRALTEQFSADDALALLAGPLGGADPLSLRRLRRGIRRVDLAAGRERATADVLRDVILGDEGNGVLDGLTDVEAAPLRRVLKVLAQARNAVAADRGLEEVLWITWQSSRLERRWTAASARGGSAGAQADRDLDAAVALFDAAAAYAGRVARAGLAGFLDYISHQQLNRPTRRGETGEAVVIITAHAATGREWDVVAVAGVQEGLWPSVRPRGSLLRVEELVDMVAGVDPDVQPLSRTAPLLAEERRLLLVACSRARRSLLVTAVESTGGEQELVPSRFLDELGIEVNCAAGQGKPQRSLALPALVAELRGVVCDPSAPEDERARAARQLARLAQAGVRGAHPDEWYGLVEPSTAAPMWQPGDDPVRLSPSTVELLRACPLRWALERHGGADQSNFHAIKGTLVHALVQALACQVPASVVQRELENAWEGLGLGNGWHNAQERRRAEAMVANFTAWLASTRTELTQAAVEVDVDFTVPGRGDDEPAARVKGRIDRLERDPDGRTVIVDIKTGKNLLTKQAAQDHAQLATYQLAAAVGGIDGEDAAAPGGGRLVYVAKAHRSDGATQRQQSPLDDEGLDQWRATIQEAAAASVGPRYLAIVNDGCRHCPVAGSCPANDSGRQVSGE
ncbi:ATP-dependent helicase [Skermania sp. ID1734]|uniref:ATP-dependent helicase n=1 Tax=Skermania sp. ID1734 TaxID=2597516 RepID=UPI00117D699E|nr:ATP-dependent DNA helicase [Skermania sp. ID1734]TSD97404.1 ATP-dependent helicase [Skermania sp. ID1734]